MEEAGLPKGILQVVNGDKEAVDAILTMTQSNLLVLSGPHRLRNISMAVAVQTANGFSVLAARKTT